MTLAPFGTLKEAYRVGLAGVETPMPEWPAAEGPAAYAALVRSWLASVEDAVWPRWEAGRWVGGAAAGMVDATREEVALMVRLYHGVHSPDILDGTPDIPTEAGQAVRDTRWHYAVEDELFNIGTGVDAVASDGSGANYVLYDPAVDIDRFKALWERRFRLQPKIWDLKDHFQRPRPWAAATALSVGGFRWTTADVEIHTGIHPSLPSGHCLQGMLGICAVLDAWLGEVEEHGTTPNDARVRLLGQYMVDRGDRRVFAGVHYMTDNIASWTLARRLIPHLFRHGGKVERFAVEAITRRSRVFRDVVDHFPADSPARAMLLDAFPEGAA